MSVTAHPHLPTLKQRRQCQHRLMFFSITFIWAGPSASSFLDRLVAAAAAVAVVVEQHTATLGTESSSSSSSSSTHTSTLIGAQTLTWPTFACLRHQWQVQDRKACPVILP